jgi:glycosyltransferase involved in cell wall biosynthesis
MNEPLVSIVTPVYNGEKYLENCIRGVQEQTYKNFEYIIVDNASTDGTAGIIEKLSRNDSRIKVFRNPSTLKVIDNFNECLKHVALDAKWVKYALADDYLFPNCVEKMVRIGEKDRSIGFVSAYHLNGKKLANEGLPLGLEIADGIEMLKKHILRKLYVCLDSPNTVLYKKSVIDEMNGFDNTYLHADTELAFRILYKHNLGFVHQVLSWTGVNEARGTTYSFYHGIFTKEYLKFGLKDIDKYKGISFTKEEMKQVSDVYADEIARYVSAHVVHFLWGDMRSLWGEAPRNVKKRIFPILWKRWPIYLRKFVGSIIHYKDLASSRPTFKC